MAVQFWFILIASIGLLMNPGDTQLINEFSKSDFGITERFSLELESGREIIVPQARKLSSGSIELTPSNSLAESELTASSVNFNGEVVSLTANRVIDFDKFISARYSNHGVTRISSCVNIVKGATTTTKTTSGEVFTKTERDTCLEEKLQIRGLTKSYEMFHENNLLEIKFADNFDILPFNSNYNQKMIVLNNYDRPVAGRVSYKITGSAVAGIEPPRQDLNMILLPGENEIEIPIPSTLFQEDSDIIGKNLEAQVRLVYDYGEFESLYVVPFEAVARNYKFEPNLKSPKVSEIKQVTRTKFFFSGQLPREEEIALEELQSSVTPVEEKISNQGVIFLIVLVAIVGGLILNR